MTPSITTIKEQFIKVIRYSQGIENPQVDALFDQWLEAKKDIIEAWGGKYIIEVPGPVSFELAAEEKKARLNEFIDVVETRYDNSDLAEFIGWATPSEIFNNKIERDFWLTGTEKISAGTKFVKAFKYFEEQEDLLRELQDRMSMIIQEDKVSGTLCFSVHPLDFISASENTYHWRSCHALDGEYRSGNLSYMLDKSTIMCYLKKPYEIVKLPNFPEDVLWNSKKWRMWLFLSDDWNAMFAGRQYPFFSLNALQILQSPLLNSLKKNHYYLWSKWYNDYINTFPREGSYTYNEQELAGRHIAMNYNVYKMGDLVSDCDNPLHFNDLLHSSFYIPYYCWAKTHNTDMRLHFSIGGLVPCLRCGGEYAIYRSNTMMCDPCELKFGEGENDDFAYCECCDTRCIRDSMQWLEGANIYVCESCYENNTKICDQCGLGWYSEDVIYDREKNQWLCPHCAAGEGPKKDTWFDDLLPF